MSVLWPSLLPTEAGEHSSNLFPTTMPIADGWIYGDILFGKTEFHGNVDENKSVRRGTLWPSVNDTFYNRILIEPVRLDMGNLLTTQTRTVLVWNGYLTNKPVTNFQKNNADGITVDEPRTVPFEMRGLEELVYEVSITTDGPAVIDADLVWVIDGGTYVCEIVGRRVVVWPYGPSWDSPVVESLAWLTDIITAFDGSEQRRGLRTKARRSFSYTFKTFREDSARVDNLLWGWQNRVYAMPVWTDKPRLTANVVPGDSVLQVPTTNYSFAKGGLAVIFLDPYHFEVVEVDTVGPNSITIARPVEASWKKGVFVMPVVLGHLPQSVSLLRYTSQAMTGGLMFECDPGVTDPYTPAAAAPTAYEGVEVIMRQPNWVTPLDITSNYMFEKLDADTGVIAWDTTETFPKITRKYTWMLNGRKEITDFRSMLGRRLGRRNDLYVPTWHDDFIVTQTLGSGDMDLHVKDANDFRLMVGANPARDRIMIRLKTGQVFFRKIVGVSVDGSSTVLILDAPLGIAVPVSNFKTVHMLMRSRLASDKVDITWKTTQVATVDTNFSTVKE